MANKRQYNYEQIAELLIKNYGNKTATADALGCDRHTVTAYCNEFATCRDALERGRNRWVDKAENKLAEKVDAGDNWAIGKVLNDLGRSRGWGEQRDKELGAIVVRVEWATDKDREDA